MQVNGSTSLPTTFQPGTASGVTFVGQSAVTNTLDLTAESASNFTALTVAMATSTGPCSGQGELTSNGAINLADCFTNVTTVDGAAAVPTTFRAGSGGGFTFTGQGSGNTLDLSNAPSGTNVSG